MTLRVVLLAVLISLPVGGCRDGDAAPVGEGTLVVAGEGGVVTSPDGLFALSVPPGALTEDTTISIAGEEDPDFGRTMYDLQPDGLVFAEPASGALTIPAQDVVFPDDDGTVVGTFGGLLEQADGTREAVATWAERDAATGALVVTTSVPHFTRLRNPATGLSVRAPGLAAMVGERDSSVLSLTLSQERIVGPGSDVMPFSHQLKTIEVEKVSGPFQIASDTMIDVAAADGSRGGVLDEDGEQFQTTLEIVCDDVGEGVIRVRIESCTSVVVNGTEASYLGQPFESGAAIDVRVTCTEGDVPPELLCLDEVIALDEAAELARELERTQALADLLFCGNEAPVEHAGMPKPPAGDETTFAALGAEEVEITEGQAEALNALPDCDNETGDDEPCSIPGDQVQDVQPGEYIAVHTVMRESIPAASDEHYQFAAVFNFGVDGFYEAPPAFPSDFWQGSHRQLEVAHAPVDSWRLSVLEAIGGSNLAQAATTGARAFKLGPALLYLGPRSELGAEVGGAIYRVTSFRHRGDYGLEPPFEWEGDNEPTVDRGMFDLEGNLVPIDLPPTACIGPDAVTMTQAGSPGLLVASVCPAPLATEPVTCPTLQSAECVALLAELGWTLFTGTGQARLTTNGVVRIVDASAGTIVGSDELDAIPIDTSVEVTLEQEGLEGTLSFSISGETLTVDAYRPPYEHL